MKNVIWIMGPTSSGKTTTAQKLMNELANRCIPSIHYDGDEVREFFGDKLGFTTEDRLRVVKTIVHLTNKAIDAGLNVVVSALTANDDARVFIRENIMDLKIVYLDCSIDTCIKRDPKGLYQDALQGKIDTLSGINTKYEPINDPDIVIESEGTTPEENTNIILDTLFK